MRFGNIGAIGLSYTYETAAVKCVRFLLAVASSQQGAAIVLATGRPVLYAGGFNGGTS